MPSPSGKGVLGDARFRGTKSAISKGTSLSYAVIADYNTIAHVKRFLWGLGGPQCTSVYSQAWSREARQRGIPGIP